MNGVEFNGETVFPSKVVCIGRNYVEHIVELGNEVPDEPVIFIKPNSAVSNDVFYNEKEAIHYEAEITFLIQSGQLEGVGFGLDLTKREVQTHLKSKGLPWERAKAFDRSAVFSRFVRLDGDISALRLELSINGCLVQQASVDFMINKPNEILKNAQDFLSFEDGDLLMTGTPKGVGKVQIGDILEGKVFNKSDLLVEGKWVVKP